MRSVYEHIEEDTIRKATWDLALDVIAQRISKLAAAQSEEDREQFIKDCCSDVAKELDRIAREKIKDGDNAHEVKEQH